VISLDFKTLARMESHRGVGYVIFLAAIFPASFLAQYFVSPAGVQSNLLVTCLVSGCVGLLVTTVFIVLVFNGLAKPEGSQDQWKQAGAGALAVGSGASLLIQIGSLLLTVNAGSIKAYLGCMCALSLATGAALVVYDFVQRRIGRASLPK